MEKQSFEASIKRLEEIIALIEKPETPIETSIELYKEASSLIRACTQTIDEAELQVKILMEGESQQGAAGEGEAID